MLELATQDERSLTLREFSSRAELDATLANDIGAKLSEGIAQRGRASLALSGGKTPIGLYQRLSEVPLHWAQVDVTLVDDRWLPPKHSDSNARLLRQYLFSGNAANAHCFPLVDDSLNLAEALAASEAALAGISWPIDVCVLGMGDDGHTASLFPCARETREALSETCQARLAFVCPVTAPFRRVTMTLPAIVQSRHVVLHIVGQGKLDVLAAALAQREPLLPIAKVLGAVPGLRTVYWSP